MRGDADMSRVFLEDDKQEIKKALDEIEDIKNEKRRSHLIAAGFISLGIFLLFVSLLSLLERIPILTLDIFWTFIVIISIGAVAFGYGFYRMGVS